MGKGLSRLTMRTRRARKRGYREIFQTSKTAEGYDDRVYAPGSSGDLLWRVEAAILTRLVVLMRNGRQRVDYLDFACGTGRVLAHLEPLVDMAVGIDISPSMLERAALKVQRARLICKDITAPDDAVEGLYDLITAFRFLTNAEAELRSAALAALRRRMRDDRSVLLLNVHGNPWSYRLLLLPYHWFRDLRRGRPLFGYMSGMEARTLLEQAGFVVDRVLGMGFVPEKLLRFVPTRLAFWLEQNLAEKPFIQGIGLNQLFVCHPKDVSRE